MAGPKILVSYKPKIVMVQVLCKSDLRIEWGNENFLKAVSKLDLTEGL